MEVECQHFLPFKEFAGIRDLHHLRNLLQKHNSHGGAESKVLDFWLWEVSEALTVGLGGHSQ